MTVLVRGNGQRRRYQVSQLVGACNSRPAPEVVKAVGTFVEEITTACASRPRSVPSTNLSSCRSVTLRRLAYSIDLADIYRHLANVIDKILRGRSGRYTNYQPIKIRAEYQSKTAKALGLEMRAMLLARRRGDRIKRPATGRLNSPQGSIGVNMSPCFLPQPDQQRIATQM